MPNQKHCWDKYANLKFWMTEPEKSQQKDFLRQEKRIKT